MAGKKRPTTRTETVPKAAGMVNEPAKPYGKGKPATIQWVAGAADQAKPARARLEAMSKPLAGRGRTVTVKGSISNFAPNRVGALIDPARLQARLDQMLAGVPATSVEQMAARMAVSKEVVIKALGLSRATVDRKVRDQRPLSPEEGERVLGLAELVQQVQRMVEESGNPEGFDAAAWVARWIQEPLPALGGVPPGAYLQTSTGQQIVSNILARMQAGTYS